MSKHVLNLIWLSMIMLSAICGLVNGRLEMVSNAILESSKKGFDLVLNLGGMMIFWMGLVCIAEKSGLVTIFARQIRPVLRFLYPDIDEDSDVMGDITMNFAANMLGLGNAATPFGIKAMEGLQAINKDKDVASDAMCMLVCINNSSVQLIPFTAMAILSQAGGLHVTDVILTSILATSVSTFVAVVFSKIMIKWSKK